jgi:hypothetical protein
MGTTFSERKELILEALAEDSSVSVADLDSVHVRVAEGADAP